MALFAFYPHYAPHEYLLASITSLTDTDCRIKIQEAQKIGAVVVKRELKPVHRALSGIRTKLNNLSSSLKVSLVRDAGYALVTSSNSTKLT